MVLHRFPWTSCGTALSPGDDDGDANDDDVMMLHNQLPHHPDGPPTWAALGLDQHLCSQLVPLERPYCWPSEVFIFFLSLFLSCAGCTLSCAGFTSTCLSPLAGIGGSPTDSPTMSSQICISTLRFYKSRPKQASARQGLVGDPQERSQCGQEHFGVF